MAAFYTCSDCGKEYLGPDDIPVEDGDHVKPMCDRCQPVCLESAQVSLGEAYNFAKKADN